MSLNLPSQFSLSPEVLHALTAKLPVVALESAVITHGLPRPYNLSLAQDMEQEIRKEGCIPATIAVMEGEIKIGLSGDELEHLANEDNVVKISRRDFAAAITKKLRGGTTVAGTLFAAQRAGIRVFATGGIGGVHPEPDYDISADLPTLADTPMIVVCAGAKAILDLPATLEYLETMSVPVVGYQTDEFPAFYSRQSGLKTSLRLDTSEEIAQYARAYWELGCSSAVLVTQPPPQGTALPHEAVDGFIRQAQQEALQKGIHGQALTPFLLGRLATLTNNATLKANLDLLINNARLAARIARALHPQIRKKTI